MLPKIIMQTWKTRTIPPDWVPSVESIHRYMPDWKYTLMTDADNRVFVSQHFAHFLPYYDAFEYPIQRADAIRYCWLYVNGGLYMDLDIEILKPLDPLFADDAEVYLVPSGNLRACLTNAFMASQPGAQLWLDCIEEMKKPAPWWAVGKHFTVMATTGPMMLNRVATRYKEIPSELIFPCSVCEPSCVPHADAYARELPGSSWCGWDSHAYNFVFCNWGKILILGFLIMVYFYNQHR